MLFLRHIIKNSFLGMCNVLCSKNKLIGKEKPLQARVERWILLKRNRASCFGSSRASITVETSLVFPVFICVLCCFIALAQMVLIETEVHYAASQTYSSHRMQEECFFRYMKAVPYVRILLMAGREEFQYILLY